MEEHFILRVPLDVAERLERILNEDTAAGNDASIDLSFLEDGRTGTFVIGDDSFPAALLDLPCVVESYKTYDDNVLIKTADVGQMIMVRKPGDPAPEAFEYRHGITPPMRDARRRRFRKDPDLNPDLVQQVENDLQKILAGGTARDVDVELVEQEEDVEEADDETLAVQLPATSGLIDNKDSVKLGEQDAQGTKDAMDVDDDDDDDEEDYD
eukprot:TRINITY_DN4973_c0_g1_i1.p1 TRINITY_DN4973_c0_g1~~TRINITY_DN4973_c0_g1_i1.p1  ORF type:complete len:211 (+),score=52.90 TRINITY_DN4973_c0_g1_i1:69-701(+)